MNGSTDMEGRVEVCYNGVWTTVSDRYSWNYNDARVLCHQLGFHDECENGLMTIQTILITIHYNKYEVHITYISAGAVAITESYFGTGNKRIIYRLFNCSGSEPSLQSCQNSTFSSQVDDWYNHGRAAVECQAKVDSSNSEAKLILFPKQN